MGEVTVGLVIGHGKEWSGIGVRMDLSLKIY